MDKRLLEAAVSGDAAEIKHLAVHEPAGVLLGTTPVGNTCLHIAAMRGHEEFCKDVLALSQPLPLLTAINEDGETPLLTAVTRGRVSVASVLLSCCRDRQLSETILKQDKRGCNALHHAIRSGHKELALELMEAEPGLSEAVNQRDDTPLFIAARRNFEDVVDKLLGFPDSAHSGASGFNVLHAAVKNGNPDMAKRVMETRPWLAKQENEHKCTLIHLAALDNRSHVVAVLLEHDPSLGYLISTGGDPLLCIAATKGHVGVARELLKHCPDATYYDANDSTCLHVAVLHGQTVEFVLGSQQLRHLINMEDNSGQTALELAERNGLTLLEACMRGESQIINNARNGAVSRWLTTKLLRTLTMGC